MGIYEWIDDIVSDYTRSLPGSYDDKENEWIRTF